MASNMVPEYAAYAVTESASRGRRFPEPPHPYRSAFERDRDRIIHCDAFRRLAGKTQVFGPGIDDNYRSRSSHSIEVSQLGRTVARVLGLNEALTEAICLAHDLGHSPFGHSGESALNKIGAAFGGFEHNRQTLRIVDLLEHPYPEFPGLNLMYETRLGLAKHHSPYDSPEFGSFAENCAPLEGQIADLADRIAYNCHDLDDAMRAGLLTLEQIKDLALVKHASARINADRIEDPSVRRTRIAKSIMDVLVSDVIETSRKEISQAGIKSLSDVYNAGHNLIAISPSAETDLRVFEKFLMTNVYLSPVIREINEHVYDSLSHLFEKLRKSHDLLPVHYQNLITSQGLDRAVIDYIAGMTDRFCLKLLDDLKKGEAP